METEKSRQNVHKIIIIESYTLSNSSFPQGNKDAMLEALVRASRSSTRF